MFNNKTRLCLLLILILNIPSIGYGQSVNFEDGFEDGDFTGNPAWTGDDSLYTITLEEGNHLLQLNGNEGDVPAYLSVPSSSITGSWEFYIKLDFSPSSGNRADIFLMSDIPDLTGPINGYALRAGENGSGDVFHIVRYDNGSEVQTILSGTTDISSGGAFRVKVSRTTGGEWSLEVAEGYDGILYPEGGTGTDLTYTSASYFGIRSTYTSTRSDKFFFDFKIDLPPFAITETVAADNKVMVSFNRSYDQSTVEDTDFSINNGIGTPSSITNTDTETVTLNYNQNIPSGKHTLTVDNISDLNGESIITTTDSFIIFGNFNPRDVIINEFVYDPPSDFGEYIEIRNRSNKYLNLQNWVIGDESGTATISTEELVLEPNGLMVLSSDTTTLFNTFGNQSYIQVWSLPALNNTGDAVKLLTDQGEVADSLYYTSLWGGDDIALERRSGSISAIYQENWGNSPASLDGTPGQPNLISADNQPPALTQLNIISDNTLQLAFDERVDSTSSYIANYQINNIGIGSATIIAPDTVELSLTSALTNALEYQLELSGIEDIFGNTISSYDTTFTYYEISSADSGDVYISEFMYAPPEEIPEYIELYNPTEKTFDLSRWTINDNTGNINTITYQQTLLPPDGFIVLTADSTLSESYPDISIIDMASRFPVLNNNGDAIVLRDSSGTLLDSLQYSQTWGEKEVALERRSKELPAKYKVNWGNSPNGFGTPGQPNEIGPDTTPPLLTDLLASSGQTIRLTFSETLESTSANDIAHYILSTDLEITEVLLINDDSVELTLSDSLSNNTDYALTVTGLTDLFGNVITGQDTSFAYYEVSPADSGQIFINEFSYNPAPGETEYIEIYNSTNQSFDLKEWTLNDNRGIPVFLATEKLIFPPKSYTVLTPDNTLLNKNPDINLVVMGNQFPALNNSGDDIVLKTQGGTVLDSLQYTSSWGGDEVGLERKTTIVSGTFRENWGPAPDDGGSPGQLNNIPADKIPPKLVELYPIDESKLHLIFSETIIAASAANFGNYRISPPRDIQLVSVKSDSITLFLADPLTSDQSYEVTVSNISDIFGNSITSTSREIGYLHLEDAIHNDIVINEIMYLPTGNQAEFVELYNRSDKNIDLTNWSFGDATSEATIIEPIQLRAHSYLAISGNATFAQTNDNAIRLAAFPNLNNAGDAFYIKNNGGKTIDSLYYQASWGENREGYSLERKDPYSASNDASNWQTNTSENGNSAGIQNISFQEDSTPPKLIFANIRNDNRIEVHFDEFIRLNDEVKFSIDGQTLSFSSFDSSNANKLFLQEFPTELKGIASKLTVSNFSDFRGNMTGSNKVSIAQPVQPKDLIINEIMFNPINDPDDNQADQSEYIELYNTRDYALSLEGIVFHDAPDEKGEVQALQPFSSRSKWVLPHETVLIYADQTQNFEQSKLADFYDLKSVNTQDIIRIDRNSLSLSSSNDAIYIADSSGAVIDSVHYSDEWHNPNLLDTKGIALERIDPGGSTNTPSNWSSSVESKGGTPKAQNSIYQDQPPTPQETGISFAPNPFSPDGDGYEDNLIISYKLDQPDYLLRVNIFDRYGRHIKELADGKPAGFEGTLIWDGRRDDERRNRIGIYIIVFEAYDSTSGKDKAFKKTVVIARKLN